MKRTRLTLALLLAATPAVAAPPPAARPAPGPAGEPSACVPGRSGAIARVACALAAELGGVPAGALVVAAPLVSDVPAPDPGRLTARVAGVVAGALGHGARSADEAASLARGRSLASAAGSLVFLQVTLARGELRVVADLFPVPRGFWERVRDPEPSPRAHAFASERLDAELRALLPPVPLVASRVDRASSPEKSPLALACGDLDGDGALELVITGRVAVHVGRIRNRAFVGSAVSRWSELSAVAPSPLRAPIGGLAIEPGRYLEVGITDRAEALRLDSTLRPLQKLGRELPWPAAGCIRVAGVALSSAPTPCRSGDGASARVELGEPLDAVAGAWVSRP
ncbi:MAG: hypothetical protein OZ921_21150, partial [Sorangiineae bacterium]|nr:hypothetical protein [Sorangiineae bacterium]